MLWCNFLQNKPLKIARGKGNNIFLLIWNNLLCKFPRIKSWRWVSILVEIDDIKKSWRWHSHMDGLKRRLQPLWRFFIFRRFKWLNNNAINKLRCERMQLIFLPGLNSTIFLLADLKILFRAKEFRFYMKNIQDFKIIPKISRKWKIIPKLEKVRRNMRNYANASGTPTLLVHCFY